MPWDIPVAAPEGLTSFCIEKASHQQCVSYRYGRVNYVLAKRLELLEEVSRLQESLGVSGDVAYTCETAGHFYLYQVHHHTELVKKIYIFAFYIFPDTEIVLL